jgi:GBP family porin
MRSLSGLRSVKLPRSGGLALDTSVHSQEKIAMKKSMLALAVLGAFAGTAAAQTSVTLYGLADVNVVYSEPGDNTEGGDDGRFLVRDGGAQGKGGSRWGLRISEDLGSGLRAYANLESGFNIDSGSAADPNREVFNRQAYVALGSKTLGDLRIGRQDTISRTLAAYFDPSDKGQIKIDDVALYEVFGSRVDNDVTYLSPSFGGFQLQASVAAGEGSPNARYQGLAGTFRSGPIALAIGYEEFDHDDTYNKAFSVGGNYNFGFAKIFAGYQKVKDPGARNGTVFQVNESGTAEDVEDRDFWTVGASVPLGQITILANYSQAKHDFEDGGDADLKKAGIAVEYALSKRTLVYSAYTYRGGDISDRLDIQQEFTILGLRHSF